MGPIALFAVLAALYLPAGAQASTEPHCHHQAKDTWLVAKTAWHRVDGPRQLERKRARHLIRCANRPQRAHRKWRHARERFRPIRERKQARRAARHETASWETRFHAMSPADQQWARSTASCESGMDRYAHSPGGRYHSYFQWLPSTWAAAGGEGHPEDTADFYEQAVIAVNWRNRTSAATQWPVCGV